MRYKIVKIEWYDARSIDDWCAVGDLNPNLIVQFSAGYLVKENDDAIFISPCVNLRQKEDEDMVVCTIVIPRKMIKKMSIIDE